MQPQPAPQVQARRLDLRGLMAAGLCVLAPFLDALGWVVAIAGLFLLRRVVMRRSAKWLFATIALAPKLAFLAVRRATAPEGISFPIEPWNLATSSSIWAWSIALALFGVYLLFQPRRSPQPLDAAATTQPQAPRQVLVVLGLAAIAGAGFLLFGLTDGFHRIDDAGQGRWTLLHAARGSVATFSPDDVASIDAAERNNSRSGRSYSVRVALRDGRTFSVSTKSAACLDELRKFATTANLQRGKVRIVRRYGANWVNGSTGFTLKDAIGRYEPLDSRDRSRTTYEFWFEGGRLAGKEMVASPEGRHVRVLRNIKVAENGTMEFEPGSFVEASKLEKGSTLFSLRWSAGGESGRFTADGLEVGLEKYRKQ